MSYISKDRPEIFGPLVSSLTFFIYLNTAYKYSVLGVRIAFEIKYTSNSLKSLQTIHMFFLGEVFKKCSAVTKNVNLIWISHTDEMNILLIAALIFLSGAIFIDWCGANTFHVSGLQRFSTAQNSGKDILRRVLVPLAQVKITFMLSL